MQNIYCVIRCKQVGRHEVRVEYGLDEDADFELIRGGLNFNEAIKLCEEGNYAGN